MLMANLGAMVTGVLIVVLFVSGCVGENTSVDDLSVDGVSYGKEYYSPSGDVGDVLFNKVKDVIEGSLVIQCTAKRRLELKAFDCRNDELLISRYLSEGEHTLYIDRFRLDDAESVLGIHICWIIPELNPPDEWNRSTEGVVCKTGAVYPPRINLEIVPETVEFVIEPKSKFPIDNCNAEFLFVKNTGDIAVDVAMVLENDSYAGGYYSDETYVFVPKESWGPHLLMPRESAQLRLKACAAEGDQDFQTTGQIVVGGDESVHSEPFAIEVRVSHAS
jgi:hypothetical protein